MSYLKSIEEMEKLNELTLKEMLEVKQEMMDAKEAKQAIINPKEAEKFEKLIESSKLYFSLAKQEMEEVLAENEKLIELLKEHLRLNPKNISRKDEVEKTIIEIVQQAKVRREALEEVRNQTLASSSLEISETPKRQAYNNPEFKFRNKSKKRVQRNSKSFVEQHPPRKGSSHINQERNKEQTNDTGIFLG